MSKYTVVITKEADEDIAALKKSGDKASLKRLKTFIDELGEHPTEGSGLPEPLKYELTGYWSRRINKKDRLIYKVEQDGEDLVIVISALGHYADR